MSLKLEDYVINAKGSGDFRSGKVQRKTDKKTFVYKEIGSATMSVTETESAKREANLLPKLDSPYLVKYMGDMVDPKSGALFIVYKVCTGGDLAGYIDTKRQQKSSIDEDFVWKVLCQICSGLTACSEQLTSNNTKMTYLDVSPSRVLLTKNNDLKLDVLGATLTQSLTHYYNPDTPKRKGRTTKSTVWSLGSLLQEMCNLDKPSKDTPVSIPSTYSKLLSDTISKMLSVDCRKRPSVDDLVSSPDLASKFQQFTSSKSRKC